MKSKTLEPPATVEGARVLYSGTFEGEKNPTSPFSKKPVQALVIGTYDNQSFYLFICDKDWKVLNGSQHPTMNVAMEYGNLAFKNEKISWKRA